MTGAERHLLVDAAYVLFRRAAQSLLVAAFCLAAGLAVSAQFPPHYTATLRLAVAPSGDAAGRAARDQAELLRDPGLIRRVLPVLRERRPASAPGLLDSLANRLGRRQAPAAPKTESDGVFAERVSRALHVQVAGDTDVVAASFGWGDPVFAADALNLIVAGYQRTGSDGADAQEALGRAQTGLEAAQGELETVDRQLVAAGPAVDAETMRAERARIEARLATARNSADTMRLDRALAQQKLESLDQTYRSGGWVDGGSASDGARPLAAGFTTLLEKRQQLMGEGREGSAEMRSLDREIARAREQNFATTRQIAAERVAGLDDRLGKGSAGIAEDEASLRGLDQQVSQTEVLGQARRHTALRVAEAQRRVAAAHARTDSGWQALGGARVVSEAVPPAEPDWPGPAMLKGLSVAAAVAGGLGFAVWAESRRRTIDRAGDFPHRLGIETLARLEEMPMPVAQLR